MTVIPTRDQIPQIVRVPGTMGPPRLAQAGAALSGQDVFRMFRKRKWMILLSVVICLAVSAAVTALWLMYYPQYTATAVLEVSQPESPLGMAGVVAYPGELMDRRKNGYAKMAKTEPVFQKTIDDPRVRATGWYRDNINEPLRKIDKDVDVTPQRETNYVYLSMTGPNQGELPEIVNAWADAFVEDATISANKVLTEKIQKNTEAQTQYKQALADAENRLNAMSESDDRVIQQKLALKTQELQTLAEAQMKAQLAVETAMRQKKNIDDMEAAGQLGQHPLVQQYLDNDPLLRALTQDLISQRTALEQLRTRFPEGHRVMQDVQARIESLTTQIADREKVVRTSATDALNDTFNRQLIMVQGEYVAIQGRVAEVTRQTTVLNDNMKTVRDLTDKMGTAKTNLDLLLRESLELNRLKTNERPVSVRRFATKPIEPSIPRWSINIPLGVVLGLIIGLGLTVLLETMDTSIKNPTDVSRRVDLPMLGMVPHLNDLDEEIEDLRLAFMTNPNSLVGESFRQVRTTLQFSAPAAQLRTLLVTSALPGDGRTTIALNLAAATAHAGRKVLVVEANFRQPMLRALFPQAADGGLSNVLVGQSHWKDLVREVHPNLFVMTGGPLPPNPAELLGSDAMRNLLVELTAEYDQVVFDGAPCVLVTDAVVLSTLMDGVVLVVRASANTYGVVQRARDILGRVGARIFGVVLNGIRVTAGGYLRKNYRTYYEYHEQHQPQQQLPRRTA